MRPVAPAFPRTPTTREQAARSTAWHHETEPRWTRGRQPKASMVSSRSMASPGPLHCREVVRAGSSEIKMRMPRILIKLGQASSPPGVESFTARDGCRGTNLQPRCPVSRNSGVEPLAGTRYSARKRLDREKRPWTRLPAISPSPGLPTVAQPTLRPIAGTKFLCDRLGPARSAAALSDA